MPSTGGIFSGTLGAAIKALEALEQAGVREDHLVRIWRDPDYAVVVARAIIGEGHKEAQLHDQLRKHMLGPTSHLLRSTEHFFGLRDWEVYAGVRFGVRDRAMAGGFPWTMDELDFADPIDSSKRIYGTHMAFWGLNREIALRSGGVLTPTIAELTRLKFWGIDIPSRMEVVFHNDLQYSSPIFLQRCDQRWHMVRLEPLYPKDEEGFIIPEDYEISSAAERLVALVLWQCLNSGETLPRGFAETSTADSNGNPIYVFVRQKGIVELAIEGVLRVLEPGFMRGLAISRRRPARR